MIRRALVNTHQAFFLLIFSPGGKRNLNWASVCDGKRMVEWLVKSPHQGQGNSFNTVVLFQWSLVPQCKGFVFLENWAVPWVMAWPKFWRKQSSLCTLGRGLVNEENNFVEKYFLHCLLVINLILLDDLTTKIQLEESWFGEQGYIEGESLKLASLTVVAQRSLPHAGDSVDASSWVGKFPFLWAFYRCWLERLAFIQSWTLVIGSNAFLVIQQFLKQLDSSLHKMTWTSLCLS